MKLFGLFFVVIFFVALPGEAVLVLKHVRCLEAVNNSKYNGNRCTVSNISLTETSYNWGRVTHPELHFANSTVPVFPERLESMMKQFVVFNMTGVKLNILTQANMRDDVNLKELYLKKNQLKILANHTFNASVSLEILDISFNEIEVIESDAFDNLKNLKHLDLSHNRLMSIGLELQDLMNLDVLNLSNNEILVIHPFAISSLPNINTLNLEHNHIRNFMLNICNEFNLQLKLGVNGMESIMLNWNPICRMGQENTLEIIAPDNHILKVSIDKQINLIHADLQRNELSNIKGMTNIKHLSTLNLAGNQISEVTFDVLCNLTNLRELNLSFNAIKTLDVSDVCEKVPSLIWLGLRGNLWDSCEYLSDVVTSLKTAKIAVDLIEGQGELSCVIMETEEQKEETEKEDEAITETTTQTIAKTTTTTSTTEPITTTTLEPLPTTTLEPLPTTTPIDDDDDGIDNGNQFWEFMKSEYLRILVGILLIFAIIAVLVRICLDCKYRRGVDLSSASYSNGGTIGTRM